MHYLDPRIERTHVAIFYHDFTAQKRPAYSHKGLGVNAQHTAAVLHRHRVRADVIGAKTASDIAQALAINPSVTHALIEAVWVSTEALAGLLAQFPQVHFLVRVHSEMGFLQVEPGAISLLRQQLLLAEQQLNLTIAANSRRLVDFIRTVYRTPILYLPNLYDLERVGRRRGERHNHRLLRIGSFGALRWLKNHTTCAAAALKIARDRGSDLEFFLSVNREEHGTTVLEAVRNLFKDLPWARLVEVEWSEWARFRQVIGDMDLSLQVSFTESFNLVTADAVAEGVPAVVSHAVEWVPENWKADPDEIQDIARIGSALLSDPASAEHGLEALEHYSEKALCVWRKYLNNDPNHIHR